MACKNITILFVALFALAAAVDQEANHPPHYHGHGHHNKPFPIHVKSEAPEPKTPLPEDQPLPGQEEVIEEYQNVGSVEEENVPEDIVEDSRKLTLKSRQEEAEDTENVVEEEEAVLTQKSVLVTCNYNLVPGKSCFDCRTRLICKSPNIGKAIACNSAIKPYCNNGICSAFPSANCS